MFKFRMTRLKNPSREYDGLWFPKAVHTVTVTTENLLEEIPRSCSLKKSDLLAALTELSEFLLHHLRQGEVVPATSIPLSVRPLQTGHIQCLPIYLESLCLS